MKNELEARFLEIDKGKLREQLSKIGAVCKTPERKMQRVVFESDYLRANRAWLRVRNEGDKITMTLKQASDATDITRVKEAEINVNNFENAKALLNGLGLEEKRNQENLRESWTYDGASIEIDTWPRIPSYVEIEADSEEKVKKVSKLLGFDYVNAVFGSVDEVYKEKYGIDILSLDNLTFRESGSGDAGRI